MILTFDDGYESTYINAIPRLARFQFRAVFYAMGNSHLRNNEWDMQAGEPAAPLMDFSNLAELHRAGHEVGVHTMSHPRLTEITDEEVVREVKESKDSIARALGATPVSFAYPYGNLNENVKHLVRKEGFHYAVATDSGGLHMADDPMQVFRVSIFPEDSTLQLWKKTSSWYRSYYQWKRGR